MTQPVSKTLYRHFNVLLSILDGISISEIIQEEKANVAHSTSHVLRFNVDVYSLLSYVHYIITHGGYVYQGI
jgi:hypothetical protein